MPTAAATDSPRRLSHQARRHQLVAAALPLLARQGPMDLSLDAVAQRAGVTRNLLYHYFPGGRADLVTAATAEAERQLLGQEGDTAPGEESDTAPPSTVDLQDALSRILDHALAPTHAWRIHRLARGAGQPAVSEIVDRSTRRILSALATVRCPGEEPAPVALLALRGYVSFAEAVLDEARLAGIPRAEVRGLLARTLTALPTAG